MSRTLSIKQFAALTGYTPYKVRKWIDRGQLEAMLIGVHWEISRKEYERYVREGLRQPDPEKIQANILARAAKRALKQQGITRAAFRSGPRQGVMTRPKLDDDLPGDY